MEDELKVEVIEEPVPCGTCRTTRYTDSSGKLVRQDIAILVDPKLVPGLQSGTGET